MWVIETPLVLFNYASSLSVTHYLHVWIKKSSFFSSNSTFVFIILFPIFLFKLLAIPWIHNLCSFFSAFKFLFWFQIFFSFIRQSIQIPVSYHNREHKEYFTAHDDVIKTINFLKKKVDKCLQDPRNPDEKYWTLFAWLII